MAVAGSMQVYIKVLEARGIKGVEKSGNSDPYVEIWVGSSKKGELKTKVYEDTVTPQWHEEFIFSLPNSSEDIHFQLYDWNRFTKNVKIGGAILQPSRMTANVGLDMWLPLDTQGELHIFCQATPLITHLGSQKLVRLSSFRMNVEREVYFPGEAIRGAIIFNVGKPRKIRGVRVKFSGSSQTHFTENHSVMVQTPQGMQQQNRTYTFTSHYIFFDPVATLYGNPRGKKDDFKIPSGGYFWPFEFNLPQGLAPTFSNGHGNNQYHIRGYVDIPMSIDKSIQQKLFVTCEYGSIHPTLITKYSQKAKSLLASDQHITVAMTAGEIAYLGEPFMIGVDIVNQGTKEVKELVFKLKSSYYFTGYNYELGHRTKKIKKEELSTKVSNIPGLPLAPGMAMKSQVAITIPQGIPLSVPEQNSPIIQVVYHFKCIMNTTGNIFTKASDHKKLPVLIGERYPFTPVFLPPAPPQITIAQAPQNVYMYLAPPPMTGEQIQPYGPVMSHDQFAQCQPYQPEQWVEPTQNAQVYDPHMQPIQSQLV